MRTAIITGGSGGLGASVTRRFLRGGWRVVVPWVEESELSRLDEHAALELVRADLFTVQGAEDTVETADRAEAPLRAVVNLVGGFAVGGRVHETPLDDVETQFRSNLRPTYLMCQAALPRLISAGGGSLVCMSSRAAIAPFPGSVGYATSKAAVLAFVDTLAVEYGPDGIRTNAILPSVIDTAANRASQPDADPAQWVSPEHLADLICFLCEESAMSMNGAHLKVYGRA